MLNNSWFRKQKPFLGYSGFGGGGQNIVLGGASSPTIEASGGIISEYTDPAGDIYRAHIFVAPANFTVSDIVGDGEIEYMLVAGGGGGGSAPSGDVPWTSPIQVTASGGGGGGFMTNIPGTPLSYVNPVTVEVATYQIVIGYGARSGSTICGTGSRAGRGMRGGDTAFGGAGIPTWSTLDASGGGGGAGTAVGTAVYGGSGGGAVTVYPGFPDGGAAGNANVGNKSPTYGELSPQQGYNGGATQPGPTGNAQGGGGGGGAAGAGQDASGPAPSSDTNGDGGAGAQMTIEDGSTTVYYGGGGGGGNAMPTSGPSAYRNAPGGGGYATDPLTFTKYGLSGYGTIPTSGPSGGRQKKGVDQGSGMAGNHGFGGGGGGAAQSGRGGTGGHGCCIIRYKIAKTTGTAKASGGLISYYPGSPISPTGAVIHTFRAPGTFTTPASFSENCDVWMIGGGGAGGADGGGGGGAGYILDLPGHPIGNSFSTPVVVGRGGMGRGYRDWYLGWASDSGGFGHKSQCPEIYPSSPTGLTAGMAGNCGGDGDAQGSPTAEPGEQGKAGVGNAGCGGGAARGGPNPPGSSVPSGAPYGGNSSPIAGGGGGGAGGNGGDCHGSTPTIPSNFKGGYGGIGVQCPQTFRNPLSTVGYPGPNGEGFWFGGGGAGAPYSDNQTTMASGFYGGGNTATSPTGSVLPMINEDPEWGDADFNYGWGGGGNSRGTDQVKNIPIQPTIGGSMTKFPETMRGCGGHAATNSGGGGGAGTRQQSQGMQWNGPSTSYRAFNPQGGDGGPGIVMIAYPQ